MFSGVLGRFSKVLLVLAFACALLAYDADGADAETALTSWYGPGFHGNPTASGEIYDAYGYTAAHKTLPLGTQLVVSYNGASLPVTVNDRGPYVGSRELDLSQGAAEYLGLDQAGVDYVDYQVTAYGDNAYQAPTTTYEEPAYQEPAAYEEPTYEEPAYEEPVYDSSGYEATTASTEATTDYSATATEPATAAYAAETGTGYASGGTADGAYVVQSGDTLSEVALQLGTSVEALAAANGIADPNYVLAGQTLYY